MLPSPPACAGPLTVDRADVFAALLVLADAGGRDFFDGIERTADFREFFRAVMGILQRSE